MTNVLTLLLGLLLGLHCPHAFTLHSVSVTRPDYQRATAEHQILWRLKLDALGLAVTDSKVARELSEAVRVAL
jgi:hypothetical protein